MTATATQELDWTINVMKDIKEFIDGAANLARKSPPRNQVFMQLAHESYAADGPWCANKVLNFIKKAIYQQPYKKEKERIRDHHAECMSIIFEWFQELHDKHKRAPAHKRKKLLYEIDREEIAILSDLAHMILAFLKSITNVRYA